MDAEKTEFCAKGGLSDYFISRFGICWLCVQYLQPFDASETLVVASRTCVARQCIPQFVDDLI